MQEIKLKSKVDPAPYLHSVPFTFKGHNVTVKKQTAGVTRVTFKNVPFNMPDEEILHLCSSVGKLVSGNVELERMNNKAI